MQELISRQLVRYLEHRGVTHIFGLCGHTNIAVLTELENSTIQFINTRHGDGEALQFGSFAKRVAEQDMGRGARAAGRVRPGLAKLDELEASDADLNAKVETMAEGFTAIRQALKALNKAARP